MDRCSALSKASPETRELHYEEVDLKKGKIFNNPYSMGEKYSS